jgi:hypothetical protein
MHASRLLFVWETRDHAQYCTRVHLQFYSSCCQLSPYHTQYTPYLIPTWQEQMSFPAPPLQALHPHMPFP